jgi:hypothetical protein
MAVDITPSGGGSARITRSGFFSNAAGNAITLMAWVRKVSVLARRRTSIDNLLSMGDAHRGRSWLHHP